MSSGSSGIRLAESIESAEPLLRALYSVSSGIVESIVSPLFDSYARILHPAYADTHERLRTPVRWATIAGATGRKIHPRVQFPNLVGIGDFENGPNEPDVWDEAPEVGTLPIDIVRALLPVLRSRTATPQVCWYASWDGFSDSRVRDLTTSRVEIPGRSMVLLVGALDAADISFKHHDYQSANLWWPADLAWCVCTDIDHVSTYVGGTRKCIDELLALPGLETLRAQRNDSFFYAGDTLNPAPTH